MKTILGLLAATASLALAPAIGWSQQGTGGGPGGPGGPTGVHMGTGGATTGSGQQQGAGNVSTGVEVPAQQKHVPKQNFSRESNSYYPRQRKPIRGKPDRGGPVETQPVPEPSTQPGDSSTLPQTGSQRGR